MTDSDVFDRRLADALRGYAAEAPSDMDPGAIARAVALRGRRTPRWNPFVDRSGLRPMPLIVVGALLLLVLMLALAAAGAHRDRDVLTVDHPGSVTVPDELFASWQADVAAAGPRVPAGTYTLELNGAGIIRGPDGRPVDWLGRVVAFSPTEPGTGELVLRSSGACGEGRYVIGTPDRTGPTAAPMTPEPTPAPVLQQIDLSGTVELTSASDACSDRVSILTAGPWLHVSQPLRTGRRYGSLAFSEPFHFVLPRLDSTVPPPTERDWGKGGLRIGNGYSWSSSFHDDQPVGVNICNPGGPTLPDVPATPEAVGRWLRSSSSLTVSDPIELTVDGRRALRFDIDAESCLSFAPPLTPPQFALGFRVYAIETGDDTILYVAWSDGGSLPYLDTGLDELVQSMTFDR